MKTPNQKIIELSTDEVKGLLDRAETGLNENDYQTLKAVFESYVYLTELVEDKRTTIDRLRKLLFGSATEKTRDVIGTKPDNSADDASPTAAADGAQSTEPTAPPPGHGRRVCLVDAAVPDDR